MGNIFKQCKMFLSNAKGILVLIKTMGSICDDVFTEYIMKINELQCHLCNNKQTEEDSVSEHMFTSGNYFGIAAFEHIPFHFLLLLSFL